MKKKNPNKQPAVFIDRDGTLVEEVDFLSTVEETRLFPFTRRAIERLKENGFLVIVATNQSGIGRGIFAEAAMHAIHEHVVSELDGMVDAFYFCPHLPCDGCECRKPLTGMIEAAKGDFDIDMDRSWMIGDRWSDVELGRNAGIRSVLVLTGYGAADSALIGQAADVLANDLGQAVDAILEVDRTIISGQNHPQDG